MKRSQLPLLSAIVLAACSGPELSPYRFELEPVLDPEMLALEDARSPRSEDWSPFLEASDPAQRGAAWRAIGRSGAAVPVDWLVELAARERDPRVLSEACFAFERRDPAAAHALLEQLLRNPDGRVRAGALRAWCQLPWKQCWPAAVAALHDPAPLVRGEAAVALGRIFGRRRDPAPDVSESTLDRVTAALCEAVIADQVPFGRWRALYAISEMIHLERRISVLVELLPRAMRDKETVRFFAARALAQFTEHPFAVKSLILLARDDSWVVAVAALQGLAGVIEDESYYTPLRAELARRLERPVIYHRRQALIGVLENDPQARGLLARALEGDPSRAVRVAAFAALHRADPAALSERRNEWLAGDDSILREAAVRALAAALDVEGAQGAALAACRDPSPLVRAAGIEVCFEQRERFGNRPALARLLAEKLTGGELGDAGTVVAQLEALHGQDEGAGWCRELDAALRAAHERFAGVAGLEIVPQIARLLDMPAAAASPDEVPFTPVDLSAIGGEGRLRVRLETERGDVVIELDGANAPRHTASFLARARAGRYDGLIFHRMVPVFVLQGLDPEGDGWGSGGVRLPSEASRKLFGPYAVGAPDAGLHTGGCQIFMTYVPVPRLEGRYTYFGWIVEGREVFWQLERGDRVLRVEPL